MKINLDIVLKNFADKPLVDETKKELTLGKAVSNILVASEEGGKMKLYSLGKKFFDSTGEIDVDASDLILVKNAVKSTKIYSIIVSGQLELILEEVK